MNKILIASAFSSALILLSACSSDDAAQVIADLEVTVSGKTTDINDAPLAGVAIEGVYTDPGGLLNPRTTSDAGGNFSFKVLKGDAFYLRGTKATYTTMNSAKGALSVDEAGLDIGIPTLFEAQDVINLVFMGAPPLLAEKAWLVVDVVSAANGNDVPGQTITAASTPDGEVYPSCNGAPGSTETIAGCADRPSPMYMAYYNAAIETTVTVGNETQTAPIRMGEITYLEFEQ
jgi:hypothetical protein